MNYGSVFSGIEAATVAWHPLGWKPVFFAEIDKFPSAVLRHHYPHVPNAGDMTTIAEDEYGAIELLVGGSPCQDFSGAGLRAGMDGKRGQLTVEYAHLAHRLGPRWLVWENVPGVLSIDGGEAFATFLGLLAGVTVKVPAGGWQNSGVIAGAPGSYGLAHRVLDAQYCGVPQRRRRVFVVGYLGDWRRAAAVLFERQSMSGHPAPRRETGQRVTGSLSARSEGGGGLGTDFECAGGVVAQTLTSGGTGARGHLDPVNTTLIPVANTGDIAHCLNAGGMGRQDYETETETETVIVTHALRADGFDASEDGTGRGTPIVPVTVSSLTRNPYGDNASQESKLVPVAMNLRGRDGGAMPELDDMASLRASSGGSSRSYVAFTCKDHDADASDISPTLRSMGHDGSHANVGGQVAVAFAQNSRDEVRLFGGDGQTVGALAAEPGMKQQTYIAGHMAVRRLTARECERLQGFPDDYTLIPMARNVVSDKKLDADYVKYMQRTARIRFSDGRIVQGEILTREACRKLAADGPRYKALGNSMAVPVMRWIGGRIAMVEQIAQAAA